jgi:hypothetical protein
MPEKIKENREFAGKLSAFRTVFFAVMALAFVFVTYLLETEISSSLAASLESEAYIAVEGRNEVEVQHDGSTLWDRFANKYYLEDLDMIKTNDSTGASIYFEDGALLRVAGDSKLQIDLGEGLKKVALKDGGVWMNTLYSADDFAVSYHGVKIDPFNSVFYAIADGDKLILYSHEGHVRVSFYGEDGEFLNSLLVTEGNKIDVNLNKLDDKLAKILYSKLIKEFHYGRWAESSKQEDVWYVENVSRDRIYSEHLTTKKNNSLRDQTLYNVSLNSLGYSFKKFLNTANSRLVLDEKRRAEKTLSFFIKHLYDAEYLYAYFDYDEANLRLGYFSDLLKEYDFSANPAARDLIAESLLEELNVFAFADVDSDFFSLKEYIRSIYLDFTAIGAKDPFDHWYVVRSYLSDASKALEVNKNLGYSLLDKYYNRVKVAVSTYDFELSSFENLIIEENQIFDNLILRSPLLYKDKYFSYKTFLEEKWLFMIDDKEALDEEKRMMVSKKITFLKRLKDYFLDEKVSLDDAKSILFRLFDEVENYREGLKGSAIDDMFADNLYDLGVFWDFLNNPEYSISLTYGTTVRERYDAFLGISKGTSGLDDLKKKILGEKGVERFPDEGTLYDAKKEVLDVFSGIGAEDLVLGEINTYSQRFVDISGMIFSEKFSCTYDRKGDFLTDITIDSEVISSGIKAEKLGILISGYKNGEKIVDDADDVVIEVKVPIETVDEKIAKVLIVDKLGQYGFEIKRENVKVKDIEAGLFEVSFKFEAENFSGQLSFELDTVSNQVSELKLVSESLNQIFEESIALENLVGFILQEVSEEEIGDDTI